MLTNDTIQLKITRPYFQLFDENIENTISISSFLWKLWIKDIVKAKMLEKKYYNKKSNTYWPFKWANEAIDFLSRYN